MSSNIDRAEMSDNGAEYQRRKIAVEENYTPFAGGCAPAQITSGAWPVRARHVRFSAGQRQPAGSKQRESPSADLSVSLHPDRSMPPPRLSSAMRFMGGVKMRW